MLHLDGLHLRQGTFELRADLSVSVGLTAIIGPSGGGKSTLLAAIAGFLDPIQGAVRWGDRDITKVAPGERPVSVLFQDNNLFPHLTVEQNIALARGHTARDLRKARPRIEEILVSIGLAGFGSRKPAALSGGQQSRAALARVLLADRPVVVLDEPFAALGPGLRSELLDFVRQQLVEDAKRTVLMVSHDPDDAKRVADRVIFVDGTTARAPEPTNAVFGSSDTAIRDYLGT